MWFCKSKKSASAPIDDPGTCYGDDPALLVGAGLVNAFVDWTNWCHRRVDSIHPLDGDQGRRKQSIDCTPPADPRLLLDPSERRVNSLQAHHGQIVLPIALVEKRSLRHFDARDAAGEPLPILNSEEISEFELDMLQNMLSIVDEVTLLPNWRENLRGLLGSGENDRASSRVKILLNSGEWDGKQIWDPAGRDPLPLTRDMIRNFASHFLLLATVDSQRAGRRQVLKYSYHWDLDEPEDDERLKAPMLAIGAMRRIPIPADQPAAAQSYHLEFHTQHEFECCALELPAGAGSPTVSNGHIDVTNKPMAHAHATYADQPKNDPYVMVRLPARGMWLSTTLAVLFTTAVFGGIQLIEFAKHWWLNAPESSAALLIAAPAVFFGLVASGREHRLVRHALGFLRGVLLFCAVSLFVLATSIVGKLRPDVFDVALPIMFFVLAGLSLFLLVGRCIVWFYVRRWVRDLRNVSASA